MNKRVTITLDDDLFKKIKILQAKLIKETTDSVSFSKTVNHILSKNIKKT